MYIKNIKELKKNLRARYRRYREKMNAEQKLRLDASIQCRLLTLEEYLHAETLFIYCLLYTSEGHVGRRLDPETGLNIFDF